MKHRDRNQGRNSLPASALSAVTRVARPASLPANLVVKPASASLIYPPGFNPEEQMLARVPDTGEPVYTNRYVPLLERLPDGTAKATGRFRDLQCGIREVIPRTPVVAMPVREVPSRSGRSRGRQPTVVYASASAD